MLALGADLDWEPPIVETVAARGEGIDAVWEAVDAHKAHLGAYGIESGRSARRRAELESAVVARLRARAAAALSGPESDVADAVGRGDIDPWSAADRLVGDNGNL